MPMDELDDFLIVGKLAPTNAVRKVKGVPLIALRARAEGKTGVLVPAQNAPEAVVAGLTVIRVQNLREVVAFREGEVTISPTKVGVGPHVRSPAGRRTGLRRPEGPGIRETGSRDRRRGKTQRPYAANNWHGSKR